MTENNELLAAIYIRVSSTKQVVDGYGVKIQLEDCKNLVKSKGWKVYKVYEDLGISGSLNEQCEGLKQMMNDAKEKKFDRVVFSRLDRLGRTANDIIQNIILLTTLGIQIASCSETIDPTTDEGISELNNAASFAEIEKSIIVERLDAGRDYRRRNIDGDIGGKLPFGYVRINNATAIDLYPSRIINRIYRLYLGKEETMAEICRILNGENIPTPTNKTWCSMFITKIVKKNRDKYMGGYRNNSKFKWPRLLEPDVVKLVKLEGRDDLLPSFKPQNLPPDQIKKRKYYRDPTPPSLDE